MLSILVPGLDGSNVGGLLALGALSHLELDRLAFLQRLVAICLDGGEMNKHILAIRLGDKPIALVVVEPLHRTLSHYINFLSDGGRPVFSAKFSPGI